MDDLSPLLGTVGPKRGERSVRQQASDTAALRTLVGPSSEDPEPTVPEVPGALANLIGPAQASVDPSLSDHLRGLTGGPKVDVRSASSQDLSALVGERGKGAVDDGWLAPELAKAGKRPLFGGRRRSGAVNYLSVAAAVLAVVAIVGTVSLALVQRATANPADDAMVSLREREAELANDTNVLQTAADLYVASVAEAVQLGESSAPVLSGLQNRVDAVPLTAAEASRTALLAAAGAAEPVSIPAYSREPMDEKSLADVGEAIDRVRLARDSLPALITDARDARSEITSAIGSFRDALRAVGAAIQAEAEKIVSTNDSAAQSFRDAVVNAAARVTTTQRAGGDGLAEMPAYVAAVDALRAENQRILALEEAERESVPARPAPRSPGSGSGGTNPGGSSNSSGNAGSGQAGGGDTDTGGGNDGGDTDGNTGGGDAGGGDTGGGDTGGGDTGGGDTGGGDIGGSTPPAGTP
jgi:hypothetical protein